MANGDRGTVARVDRATGSLLLRTRHGDVELDRGFLASSTHAGEPPLVHGYAITCHVAQGATVDRAFVLADAGMCREWGYTALTRGRHENHLYVAAAPSRERDEFGPRGRFDDAGDPLDRLAGALGRSQAQELASDRRREGGIER